MKATIIVAAILVVITLVVGLIMYFRKPGDKPKQDSSGNIESVVDEGEDSVEGNGEESETTHVNDSRYIVGETYTVQTNLRVREGPDKNKYRILDRSELMPEDYAKSVDSNTTTDALLEKGSKVTCLEMSGKWMRIPSGWICVEDEGEVLVK